MLDWRLGLPPSSLSSSWPRTKSDWRQSRRPPDGDGHQAIVHQSLVERLQIASQEAMVWARCLPRHPYQSKPSFRASAYHSRREAKARSPTAGGPAVAFKPRVRAVSNDEFLTQSELAERLGVCRQTVVRWVNAGMPCSVRRGSVVRINLAEARPWLANGGGQKPAAPRRVGRPSNIERLREKRRVKRPAKLPPDRRPMLTP